MNQALETLFTSFWKERDEVRKRMVFHALSALTSNKATPRMLCDIIKKDYGLKSFHEAFVVSVITTDFSEHVTSTSGDMYTFDYRPTPVIDKRFERLKSAFMRLHSRQGNPLRDNEYEEVIKLLIDYVSSSTFEKEKLEIPDYIQGRGQHFDFKKGAEKELKKRGFSDEGILAKVFVEMWGSGDKNLVEYLLDYMSALLRVDGIRWFENTMLDRTERELKGTTVILDSSAIFPLLLENNKDHITTLTALNTAIEKEVGVKLLVDSWKEFENTLRFWDGTRRGDGSWMFKKGFRTEEIPMDFGISKMLWQDYKIEKQKGFDTLRSLGIEIVHHFNMLQDTEWLDEEFDKMMVQHYDSPNAPNCMHDRTLAHFFHICQERNNCWVVSRHWKIIGFCGRISRGESNGAMHVNQFLGWLTEFLSMEVPPDTWRDTARNLLDKTILDTENRSPESLAATIGAIIDWKDNPAELLQAIKNIPRFKGVMKLWVRGGDENEFEKALAEFITEDLADLIDKVTKENEEKRGRMVGMQKRIKELESAVHRGKTKETLEISKELCMQTLDFLIDTDMLNNDKALLRSRLSQSNPQDMIKIMELLISLAKKKYPDAAERLDIKRRELLSSIAGESSS